jgi:hypothetical protein
VPKHLGILPQKAWKLFMIWKYGAKSGYSWPLHPKTAIRNASRGQACKPLGQSAVAEWVFRRSRTLFRDESERHSGIGPNTLRSEATLAFSFCRKCSGSSRIWSGEKRRK